MLNAIYDRVFFDDARFDIPEKNRIIQDIKCCIELFKQESKEQANEISMMYNIIILYLKEIKNYFNEIEELPIYIKEYIRKSRQLLKVKLKIKNISSVMKSELFNN